MVLVQSLFSRAGIEMQTHKSDMWTQREEGGMNEEVALMYIHYHV